MGILERVFATGLVVLAGCYSPTVLDCTVSCGSADDCTRGQVCGADGFCAAPGVAGQCGATTLDAAVRVDGSALVSLRVQITGKGSIVVDGHGICSSQDAQHGDCSYSVALNVAQSVHAFGILPDLFVSWTSTTCSGQGASCTFTPVAATTITVKFDHH